MMYLMGIVKFIHRWFIIVILCMFLLILCQGCATATNDCSLICKDKGGLISIEDFDGLLFCNCRDTVEYYPKR